MSTLNFADALRAKQLGEALMKELAQLPRNQWHKVSFSIRRNDDGGMMIAGLSAVDDNNLGEKVG